MATAETCRSACGGALMEESAACENGAVAVRRRRMEIRRFKMLTNANGFVEQPVSKRLRPVSGIYHNTPPRDVDEDGSHTLCVADRNNAVFDSSGSRIEWKQDNSASRASVCEVLVREPGEAASSLSSAWERPSGGEHASRYIDDGCESNASGILSSVSDGMSSGGSSTFGDFQGNDSDVRSSLTFGGDNQNDIGLEQVGEPEGYNSLASSGPDSPGPIGMAASSSTDTITVADVDIPPLEVPNIFLQQPSPWQVSTEGNLSEGSLVHSMAVPEDGAGSSTPSKCVASNDCPPHGMVSLCGRRREMEDAVVAKPAFMMLPCDVVGGCASSGSEVNGVAGGSDGNSAVSPVHFFGVYDGHGGSQAANFCAEHLHHALAEDMRTCFIPNTGADQVPTNWEFQWLQAMTSCFMRMDAEVGGFCWREGECGQPEGSPRCCSEPIAPETVGTTATIAVVGSCQIIVGNCGDSRAVLSRGGVAIPLSVDHKPEREDEMARVEAAGGRVIYWNGYRVLGVLAMSRAIGDRYLKPYVIAEPEVKCIKRAEDDECLILASDGLWDVMSNEVVCDIARRALNCRRNGHPATDSPHSISSEEDSPAAQAAALLVKLALAKGSSDNISVVVVDLKVNQNR